MNHAERQVSATGAAPGATPGTAPVIAVLGLGEAGSLIARDLLAAGAIVRGYDPAVTAPDGLIGVGGLPVAGADPGAVARPDPAPPCNRPHDAGPPPPHLPPPAPPP